MKFIVSSSELLSHLQSVSKAISGKSTIPILDSFLFDLKSRELTITASDLESTLITSLSLENSDGDGRVALEAKRLLDILREFPEQPLTFEFDLESLAVTILSENGKFSIVGSPADEYPQFPELVKDATIKFVIKSDILDTGISKTIFATANDELRPVMNGIYFSMTDKDITFVASDSHKLVRYKRTDANADGESSFILPKKPANLLKGLLSGIDEDVTVEFDEKNAVFTFLGFKLICRLTEGKFPNYESVIPTENPNKLIINRADLYNTVKRVSVFSNQASNLIKLHLTANEITVSAQDIDFSISAHERLTCQYEGDDMEIGFKSVFLSEIIANMGSQEVVLEMSDPSKAGIMLPFESDSEHEDVLMLLMPMMINS
ncbi:MAG: DNA polymerase III subunit beta [Bacteroidales bacterium]|nr:DNA polymerase III subunit beta [Bacteroidales bacterium]